MKLISDLRVTTVFKKYPEFVNIQMNDLRELILSTAEKTPDLLELEETLKWGEPSYLTKHGSTIRMDWKLKHPHQYALYFKCTSKLVPTFKQIYPDDFHFEDNRAIIFQLNDDIPKEKLCHCISLALTYHKVKHLPLLGA